ncbi:MFS transporter [Crossiella sp. NPDC003009]
MNAGYRAVWWASTTSALGSGITAVAGPLLVAAHTADPTAIAAATALTWLPWLLFGLPAGAIADRVDRRWLLVTVDLARVAAVGGLSVLVLTGTDQLWSLYLCLFAVHTGEVLFRAASQTLIPALVPRRDLERANARMEGGVAVSQGMAAGPLGGLLFGLGAGLPFLVDAATYAVSAVLLALLPGTFRVTRAQPSPPLRAEIAAGLRWLRDHRLLRALAVVDGLLNLTMTAAAAVLVLFLRERLHVGPAGYGVLMAVLAVGGVLGAVVAERIVTRLGHHRTVRLGILAEAALHLAMAVVEDRLLFGAVLLVLGVHGTVWGVVCVTLRQRLVPPELLGRVGATLLFTGRAGNVVGALLGGVLAERWGLTAPFWLGCAVACGLTIGTWRVFTGTAQPAAW